MEYAFKIIRQEGQKMILKSEDDGTETIWPVNKIPSGLKEGDKVFFYLSPKRSQIAKNILNEILETGSEDN